MQSSLVITDELHMLIISKSQLLKKVFQPLSSHVARVIARYSALALDPATICCFLLFQDIRLPPMKIQYPEVERLSVGEPAQSASV